MNLENSLLKTLTTNSLELSGDISELTIDQFLENGLLKEIPFFSVFYKGIKTITGIRDALFGMKVYKFICEFDQIKQSDKDLILTKLESNNKERTQVAQTIIMILDKLNELDKTQTIANLVAAYGNSEISKSELNQMCTIVEKAFIDNLKEFAEMKSYDDLSQDTQVNLSSLGLMIPIIQDLKSLYGESVIIEENRNTIVYVNSKLGMKMRKYIKL
ncbi:hypothetical protein J1N10_11415 [Carboxylicivirga sp. A043]|uniref:hypothetical protein n=1 Tax=Carboxylicivirga litoralis TaxID=2816963 RepID=UPI0021CB3103|nr:hypothetical protein [Carboxylicivirga sp. A043]MCU4156586.1 hypothetical protein [Carboxylicivirga sp. A043]